MTSRNGNGSIAPGGTSLVPLSERPRTKAQLEQHLAIREAQVAGSQATVIHLEERLAELEFALEDVGWRRLNQDSDREFSNAGLLNLIRFARYSFLKNPLINHAVLVQSDYIWGQGVSIQAHDPDVNDVVQSFLDDKKNLKAFTSHEARLMSEIMLQVEANIFIVLFTNRDTGRVKVRTLPVEEILAGDIITNPNDLDEPWYYKRSWTQRTFDKRTGAQEMKPMTAYYPDWRYRPVGTDRLDKIGGSDVYWDMPVYHIKVGGLRGMRFGVPEVYSSLDWAQAVKNDLEDYATLRRALARFAFQLTAKGGKPAVAAAKRKLNTTFASGDAAEVQESNPPAVVGSTFITGSPDYKLEPIRTAGAAPSPEEGRRLWLMVSAGTGIPETILSGNSDVGNYATAKTLDRPTELKMRNRQVLWSDIHNDLFLYCIEKAVEADNGPLTGTVTLDEDGEVEIVLDNDPDTGEPRVLDVDVDFPSILERDPKERVDAIIAAATLGGATKAGTMDDKTLVRLLMQALGEEGDQIEEMMDLLFPEEQDIDPLTGQPREPVEDRAPQPEEDPDMSTLPDGTELPEDPDAVDAPVEESDPLLLSGQDSFLLPPTDVELFTEAWIEGRLLALKEVAAATGAAPVAQPKMVFGQLNKKFVATAKPGPAGGVTGVPKKPSLTAAERKARHEAYVAKVKVAIPKLEGFIKILQSMPTLSPGNKKKLQAYTARLAKYKSIAAGTYKRPSPAAKPKVAVAAVVAKPVAKPGSVVKVSVSDRRRGPLDGTEAHSAMIELREALQAFLRATKGHIDDDDEGGASASPFDQLYEAEGEVRHLVEYNAVHGAGGLFASHHGGGAAGGASGAPEGETFVKNLGGSTGATLVKDSAGNLYVKKKGASPDHLREESSADRVYEAMGIPVPAHRLVETPQGPVKYSNYLDGAKPLPVAMRETDDAGRAAIRKQLHDGFATDAVLGNWDVIGLEADNVLVHKGTVYRVDNGGSLRFRAQGAPKGSTFGTSVGETTRMRAEGGSNPNTGRAFKAVTDKEIGAQAQVMKAKKQQILDAVDPAVRPTLSARIDDLAARFPG